MTAPKTKEDLSMAHKPAADTAAKMQKLRRAVERLRNLRGLPTSPPQRSSWFERLKLRLGLGNGAAQPEEEA